MSCHECLVIVLNCSVGFVITTSCMICIEALAVRLSGRAASWPRSWKRRPHRAYTCFNMYFVVPRFAFLNRRWCTRTLSSIQNCSRGSDVSVPKMRNAAQRSTCKSPRTLYRHCSRRPTDSLAVRENVHVAKRVLRVLKYCASIRTYLADAIFVSTACAAT